MEGIKVEDLYLVGVHRYCFQAGKPGKILGFYLCTPEGSTPRPCFHIAFEGQREDYIAFSDIKEGNWEYTTMAEIAAGNIPKVNK